MASFAPIGSGAVVLAGEAGGGALRAGVHAARISASVESVVAARKVAAS